MVFQYFSSLNFPWRQEWVRWYKTSALTNEIESMKATKHISTSVNVFIYVRIGRARHVCVCVCAVTGFWFGSVLVRNRRVVSIHFIPSLWHWRQSNMRNICIFQKFFHVDHLVLRSSSIHLLLHLYVSNWIYSVWANSSTSYSYAGRMHSARELSYVTGTTRETISTLNLDSDKPQWKSVQSNLLKRCWLPNMY